MKQCDSQVIICEYNFVYIINSINRTQIKNEHVCKQQQIALVKIVCHYNRLMITHIGMKLSTHTYHIIHTILQFISMAISPKKQPRAQLCTSALLKLANYSTHGDDTHCTCVLCRFHDNHTQKMASSISLYEYFITSPTCNLYNVWKLNLVHMCIWCFHHDHEQKMTSGHLQMCLCVAHQERCDVVQTLIGLVNSN